jgi:hypothetical protein
MSYRALSCLVVGIVGCASIHGGPLGVAVTGEGHRVRDAEAPELRLVISARQLPMLSSCYFGAVEVTFENRSPDWISIRQVDFDFGRMGRDGHVRLPEGTRVRAWLEATLQRNLIRYGDSPNAPDLVAFGVLATATESHPPPVDLATTVAQALDSHLLAAPFSVPPRLFIKKWVLIQSDGAAIARPMGSAILSYQLEDNSAARVLVDLSDSTRTSEWQRPCVTLR